MIDLDQDAVETGSCPTERHRCHGDRSVRDPADPDEAGNPRAFHEFGWSTHDVQVDEAGIAWVVGGNGTIAFDVSPDAYPVPGKEGAAALLEPTIVARTGPNAHRRQRLQHGPRLRWARATR